MNDTVMKLTTNATRLIGALATMPLDLIDQYIARSADDDIDVEPYETI